MKESTQSLLLAPAGLYLPLLAALLLTMLRPPVHVASGPPTRLVELFLIGIACQCLHCIEEFVTGIHLVFPPLFDLAPVSAEVFVGFNVFWIGIWAVSVLGIMRGSRIAYFPAWFFALAMCLNGVAHPLLSVWQSGYFPGLITSPLVGIIGLVIMRQLFHSTSLAKINAGHP
jgi:hypothetical protein